MPKSVDTYLVYDAFTNYITKPTHCNCYHTKHIRGLDDEEIRLDILDESRQDLSLEDTLSYVEAKERGKRSASHLIGDSSINAAAVVSSYKRQGKVRAPIDPTESKGSSTCCYCGSTGHGSSMQERSSFGKICTKCNISNYFANVCRQSSRRPTNPAPSSSPNALGDSAATFDSLCSMSEAAPVSDAHAVLLDHHVYNEICKAWEKRASHTPHGRPRRPPGRPPHPHPSPRPLAGGRQRRP